MQSLTMLGVGLGVAPALVVLLPASCCYCSYGCAFGRWLLLLLLLPAAVACHFCGCLLPAPVPDSLLDAALDTGLEKNKKQKTQLV